MKSFILDTDIGWDCDDAAAIALLLHYHKQKKANMLAMTACSTREGASAAIQAICDYYGVSIPIGRMAPPAIPCDADNSYAKAVMEKYGAKESEVESVSLLRKTLAQSQEKVVLITIGPLTNVSRLLKSGADEYSPLNGVELVREKVEKAYLMGGEVQENFHRGVVPFKKVYPEWNILQDIESARYVAEHFPVDMIYAPHEAGNSVLTDMRDGDSPVWYSMRKCAENMEKLTDWTNYQRMSWDPITCMVAVEGVGDFYELSPNGKMTITEEGITVFDPTEQRGHYYLVIKPTFAEIASYLNRMLKESEENL